MLATNSKAVAEGIAIVKEMLPAANRVQREPVPASHIVVGLQCGGSDGYSGITANPALGYCSDLLAELGGTSVLIVVGVALDTMRQMESQMMMRHYEGFLR